MDKAEKIKRYQEFAKEFNNRVWHDAMDALLSGDPYIKVAADPATPIGVGMTKLEQAVRNFVGRLGTISDLAQAKELIDAIADMDARRVTVVERAIAWTQQYTPIPVVVPVYDPPGPDCINLPPEPEPLTDEQKRMGLRSRKWIDCPEYNADWDD